MSHNRRTYNVKRGDKWDGIAITYNLTGKNFAGITIIASLKDEPNSGGNIHVFSPSFNTDTIGVAVVEPLTIAGADTATFPINTPLYGDVQISGPGDFGPYTAVEFILVVKPDISS
jgi:hypothetical protein